MHQLMRFHHPTSIQRMVEPDPPQKKQHQVCLRLFKPVQFQQLQTICAHSPDTIQPHCFCYAATLLHC